MKNRFLNMLNNPVPHPDLTDAIFNSVSEPELCLSVKELKITVDIPLIYDRMVI